MKRENTKASLLSRWKSKQKDHGGINSIEKAPDGAQLPLSGGQQRLWFLQQLYQENPVYNYSECLKFEGELNIDVLERSFNLILAKNEALRLFFKLENDQLIQKVSSNDKIDFVKFNLSEFEQEEKDMRISSILSSEARKCFDLSKPPLVRAVLLKLSGSAYILFITMHHIIFDKWSMDILLNQLSSNYTKLLSGVSVAVDQYRLQFTDYAYWQQNRIIDPEQLNYWKKKLAGDIPFLELPTDYPLPKFRQFKGAEHTRHLPKKLSEKVLHLVRELETTPYVLLLSTYYLFLFKYSGQKDLLIGSPISSRDKKVLEDIMGFFDDTIVLRANITPSNSFSTLVKEVNSIVLEAFSNKDISFDTVVKNIRPERSLGNNPFFRTMFIYHAVQPTQSFGPNLQVEHSFHNAGVSKFDLTLFVANSNGCLSTSFEYATDIFSETTIIRLQDHLEVLLEEIVVSPNKSLAEIEMITSEDKQFFFPGPTPQKKPFDGFQGIHQIIETTALKNPTAIAVTFGNKSITYEVLMRSADVLAHTILESTRGSNEIVGLCTERSVSMIVGLVAILKAGCAYLPLDPEYPLQRIDFMLNDSSVPMVLTQKSLHSRFDHFKEKVLLIDDVNDRKTENPNNLPLVSSDALAYVIYTSGSTGKPKGVPITHSNIINSTEGRLTFYPESPKAFLLMSSIAFDSSKAGIFWTLCTGGNLVITEKHIEQDLANLATLISKNSATHTLMLPSLFKLILEHCDLSALKSLTTVIVAGEACPSVLCNAHFEKLPHTALYNEYGPTEGTVWCIAKKMEEKDGLGTVPIGKPVANAEVYLLDDSKKMVPFGAIGEIYIGGISLSNGYLNRPELTNSIYVRNPFNKNPEAKLYKTGDWGRYDLNGDILFLGRGDQQVKIRGHRIEMDEIEKTINENAMVDNAIVVMEGAQKVLDANSEDNDLVENINHYLNDSEIARLLDELESLNSVEKDYFLAQILSLETQQN